MHLKSGMFVLLANDMRSPKFEEVEPVLCAETVEEIVQYLDSQRSPAPYMDGKWGKSFAKGSPLEWLNCDKSTAEELLCERYGARIIQWFADEVPSIAELAAE